MTFHVFVTSPRPGLSFVKAPYTVECKDVFATQQQAQAFADARVMSAAVVALLDAMPSYFPEWAEGQAVKAGDYRAHAGKTWRCRQDHTTLATWEPPNVPALWLLVPNPGASAWIAGAAYEMPSQSTHTGTLYNLIQPHTSQPGWEPPNVPALWAAAGPASQVSPYTRARWDVVSSTDPDYTEVNRAKEA